MTKLDKPLRRELEIGDKVRERDASLIVLDHGQAAGAEPSAATSEDDAYYAQFQVPDDLIW